MAFATPIGERGPLRPSNQPRPKRPPGLALGAAPVVVGSACRARRFWPTSGSPGAFVSSSVESVRRRILGDGHLAGLEALDQDLTGGRDRDRQERPEEAGRRGPDQDAEDHEERRDARRVAHHERDEDVALDELEDEIDTGHGEGELGRDRRRDDDGRDRSEERPDDRDRLRKGRKQTEEDAEGTPSRV